MIIQRFVVTQKRDRYLSFIRNEKTRKKFINQLYHFDEFDSQFVVEIPPALHDPEPIEKILREKGAGNTCHVISTDKKLDRRKMPLSEVIVEINGSGDGTIVSCISGKLAYFEGEYRTRFILERKD